MVINPLSDFSLSDVPEYIYHPIRFVHKKDLERIERDGRVLRLPRKAYNKMLKKHGCMWLHKVHMMPHEVGTIKFIEDGIEYEGTYSYWAKDWNVHMTKPFDVYCGRHMMYMIPATFWDKSRHGVYALMKNEMIFKCGEISKMKNDENRLTADGFNAKMMTESLCAYVSGIAGRSIFPKMDFEDSIYEGHIIDSGKYAEDEDGNPFLSDSGKDIGMIFWGGHYSADESDAESKAWISLLEDCIGQCRDEDIRDIHTLTKALETFGPHIDLNFKNIDELDDFLKLKS